MVLYSVLFLILAALAPPLILLGIIYRLDQIEREPPGLLWSLFLRGVLAMFPFWCWRCWPTSSSTFSTGGPWSTSSWPTSWCGVH